MDEVQWPLLLLFSLLILLALFGNLLVCAAILWDRPLRRQPENLFLVSLAVSDLLVSVLVMMCAAASDLLGYWPFGQIYCQFWVSFDITCCTASILNLCAISLDRYWHISRPMVYVRYCNRRRIYYAIVVVWLVSAAIGAAPLGFGFGSKVTIHNETKMARCEMRLPMLYAISSSLLSFFVPAAVMVLLYTKLYLYARKHVRSIKTQLQQATSFLIMQLASEKIREVTAATLKGEALLPPSSTPVRSARRSPKPPSKTVEHHYELPESPVSHYYKMRSTVLSKLHFLCPNCIAPKTTRESQPSNNNNRNNVSDQKARLTLGVIMGTFLVCWLPFFLVNIARSFSPNSFSQNSILAVTWLGYANSAANPLIYSIFNRDFRRAFKKIIVNIFHCREEQDLNKSISSRYAVPEVERRRSCTKSSESNHENNNEQPTRLVVLTTSAGSAITEE
ncbi:unnamed protein product [Caenorhabditis auriculariae]|uniref:G-protein coupled receptors family 1 profile domain-containing protein n=1 Tax=Caenorhabditis auriculariae TaxID=2777116 RepID=A0A8S1H5E1_9PELO|nr:unnamed protein product [Caenorhabditis auriculariae]